MKKRRKISSDNLANKEKEEPKKEKVGAFDLWKPILFLAFIMIFYQLFFLFFGEGLISFSYFLGKTFQYFGFFLELLCFGYLGFKASSVFLKKPSFAFLSGFFCGALSNMVSSVVKFFNFSIFFSPESYSKTIDILTSGGIITSEAAFNMVGFVTIFVLVFGIIFAGLLGGLFTWIFYLIFRERNK